LLNKDHDTEEFSELLSELIANPFSIIAGNILAKAIFKLGARFAIVGLGALGVDGPDEIGAGLTAIFAVGEIFIGVYLSNKIGESKADLELKTSMTNSLSKAINFMQQYDPHLADEMRKKGPGLIQEVIGVDNMASNYIDEKIKGVTTGSIWSRAANAADDFTGL